MTTKKPLSRKLLDLVKFDGWENAITGLNNALRDKRAQTQVGTRKIWGVDELTEAYRGDDFTANIVDIVADEMTREWIDFRCDDAEIEENVRDFLDSMSAQTKINEALKWSRLYGGGAVLLGVDDGQMPDQPLDMERVKSMNFLTSLDRWVLVPRSYYNEPLAPKFGQVETYYLQLSYGGAVTGIEVSQIQVVIHESRLLIFRGTTLPLRYSYTEQGYGDSVLTRCFEVARDCATSWSSAAALIQDFGQATYKIAGLREAYASDNADYVKNRLAGMDMSRSVIRAVLLDAEGEDFERKATPVTGLPELLDKLILRLSAATRIPVRLLMGAAPSGLGDTGDSEMTMFYDRVKSQQEIQLRPALEKLLTCVLRAKNGPTKGVEPANWSFTFKPLWQMSETEQKTVYLQQAQADQIYIQNQVLDPVEVRASRFGNAEWSDQTQLSLEHDPSQVTAALKPGETSGAAVGASTPTDVNEEENAKPQ